MRVRSQRIIRCHRLGIRYPLHIHLIQPGTVILAGRKQTLPHHKRRRHIEVSRARRLDFPQFPATRRLPSDQRPFVESDDLRHSAKRRQKASAVRSLPSRRLPHSLSRNRMQRREGCVRRPGLDHNPRGRPKRRTGKTPLRRTHPILLAQIREPQEPARGQIKTMQVPEGP